MIPTNDAGSDGHEPPYPWIEDPDPDVLDEDAFAPEREEEMLAHLRRVAVKLDLANRKPFVPPPPHPPLVNVDYGPLIEDPEEGTGGEPGADPLDWHAGGESPERHALQPGQVPHIANPTPPEADPPAAHPTGAFAAPAAPVAHEPLVKVRHHGAFVQPFRPVNLAGMDEAPPIPKTSLVGGAAVAAAIAQKRGEHFGHFVHGDRTERGVRGVAHLIANPAGQVAAWGANTFDPDDRFDKYHMANATGPYSGHEYPGDVYQEFPLSRRGSSQVVAPADMDRQRNAERRRNQAAEEAIRAGNLHAHVTFTQHPVLAPLMKEALKGDNTAAQMLHYELADMGHPAAERMLRLTPDGPQVVHGPELAGLLAEEEPSA